MAWNNAIKREGGAGGEGEVKGGKREKGEKKKGKGKKGIGNN
jgi:hypothetical protein